MLLAPFAFAVVFIGGAAPQGGGPQGGGTQDGGRGHGDAGPRLYQCARLHVSPTEVQAPGFLLVRDGRVAFVGGAAPAPVPEGTKTVDLGKATVMPGMFDAHSYLGAQGELAEKITAITPGLKAAEALDAWNEQIPKMAGAGITSYLLSPSDENVAGGMAALVKTASAQSEQAEVLTADVALKLSLANEALMPERKPTALMGAVELLRASLLQARQRVGAGKTTLAFGADDVSGFFPALSGEVPVVFAARTGAAIVEATDLAREFGLKLVLVHADEAQHVIREIKAVGAGVILAPLSQSSRTRDLELPALLAREHVRFAFGTAAPTTGGPDTLRLSAALAVRNGCPRDVALAAITSEGPALLGQDQKVGTLRVGRDADFLVVDGDPLDLATRILSVHVKGREVAREKEAKK